MNKPLPSQRELLERYAYDPITGEFRFNKHPYKAYEGRLCGSVGQKGYATVKYKGETYKVHRLIWMMMTGDDPGELTIDHDDRNKVNNIWTNLRLANCSQQQANKEARGIQETPWGFTVRIMADGVRRTIGTFKTEAEALQTYQLKCKELRGEFAPY